MRIDLNKLKETTMPCLYDGSGMMTTMKYEDENYRITPTALHVGGTIGMHRVDDGDCLVYVLSGEGEAICDGERESLSSGVMHICRKGSSHSVTNLGSEDLVMLVTKITK